MAGIPEAPAGQTSIQQGSPKLPFCRALWVQVLLAMVAAVAPGYLRPEQAGAMKPLGDAFIFVLVTMIITLIIFCTVVTGIAGMGKLKKVGRVGGMALLYFEVVSTLALLIGLLVGNVVHPGRGFNVNVTDFLMHIIPTTVLTPLPKGIFLQVVLIAILFGFALAAVGPRSKPLVDLLDALILMKFAPIGAFGAMAYTIGKFGACLALFVAQATNTQLTLIQQLTVLAVAVLTSKGASGVQDASLSALVATLSVTPTIPVAGMALILGIDRFLRMFRALVNMIGNGVATLVLARW